MAIYFPTETLNSYLFNHEYKKREDNLYSNCKFLIHIIIWIVYMYKVWKHLCCWHFMWGWHEPWHNNCQNVCWQNVLKFLVNFYFFYLGIVFKLFIVFVKSYKNTIFLHTFIFNLELNTKTFSLLQVHVYSIFLLFNPWIILYYWSYIITNVGNPP